MYNTNYIFEKYMLFHIQKIKVKNFIVAVVLLNFPYTFRFLIPPLPLLFNFFLVSLVMWRIFINFYVACIFLVILFSFLWRTLRNTWKSLYRQLQVPIIIFNKKDLANISSISNSKNPPWNPLSSVLENFY